MQRTRSTLRTLREINAHHLLHPLGHGQGLPRRGWRGVVEELTALRQSARFTPVGEKAVVAEADKAGGEDMEEEAAEEGMGVHRKVRQRILYVYGQLSRLDFPVSNSRLEYLIFPPNMWRCTTSCSVAKKMRGFHADNTAE